ncbi:MAG: hypothetical protein M1153_02860 [Patescibacteria group bacterium]|nr:hypothetical protein [Patescibacteria group bacterium]
MLAEKVRERLAEVGAKGFAVVEKEKIILIDWEEICRVRAENAGSWGGVVLEAIRRSGWKWKIK